MKTRYLSPEDQARVATLKSELWELARYGDQADEDYDFNLQMIEDGLEDLALADHLAWRREFKTRAKLTPRRKKTEGREE